MMREEYPLRIERARALMQEQGLDALFLCTGPNLMYFTGMPCGRSGSRPFAYLLPRRGEPLLIVHQARQREARRCTEVADVRTYSRLSHLPIQEVRRGLEEHGLQQGRLAAELGGEMAMDIPFADFAALQEALPGAQWVDASPLLWKLRMLKSKVEVACLERACQITSEAYAWTYAQVRQGMSEAQIQGLMLGRMIALGGSSPWVTITSGKGHYDLVSKGPADRRVERGDLVWMDGGCAVEGYWSDFDRAGVVGGPTAEQEEAQRIVHQITWMGVEMMRPGVPVAEIASRCNQAIKALGFSITSDISGLAGRVGHGIGLLVTELPSLSEEDQTVVEAGMVLTIEPGVATQYGTFHIEENVLVTHEGPRALSTAQRELWTI
jgi:Xaa-Pro aminopeptidase